MIPTNGRHQKRRPAWPVALGAMVVTAALVVGIIAYAAKPDVPRGQTMTMAPTQAAPVLEAPPALQEWPRWGLTHTGVSANNVTPEFEQTAAGALARTPMVQNQHIMGFGALNPEPRPGEFYWEDLDSRTNLMKQSGGTQVMTLCCAPDWMKGGPEGPTSDAGWDEHLEAAPYPKHFDDFAKLSAAVATKYRDVKYFMVWNEFKGFWKDHSKPADFKGYTALYNKVYTAVKAARPDAMVGGPYSRLRQQQDGQVRAAGAVGGRQPERAGRLRVLVQEQEGRRLRGGRRRLADRRPRDAARRVRGFGQVQRGYHLAAREDR